MALAVDIGLGLVLLLSIIAGVRNGFLDSVFSVASWLGGAILGLYLPRTLLPHLPPTLRNFPGASVLAGVVVFLLVFFIVRLLGVALSGNGKSSIGPVDRTLGLMIGIARGILLGAIIGCFLVAYLPTDGSIMRNSHALPILKPAGRLVAGAAPVKIRGRMNEGWNRLGEAESRASGRPGTVPV